MSAEAGAELAMLIADVYELAGILRRHGEEIAASAGQSQARWQLLSVLSEGDWTVPQAARRLGVSRQAVQRIADDLAGEGLIRSRPNPSHQRSALLELTTQGTDTLADITAAAHRWQSVIATALDQSTLQQTRHALRQLLDGIASAQEPAAMRPATST